MAATIDLSGQVALVTGASRGLGRAAALALAAAGADLALSGRAVADLERTAEEAARHGVRARIFPAELREPAAIARMVDDVLAAFDGRVDVLINNAGIAGAEKSFLELTAEDWDDCLAVDLRAPALLAARVARAMVARRRGRIVNIASMGGLKPIHRLAPYCASKAALVHLTRVMALELARHDVRVNAICPGYFRTPMNEAFFDTPKGQAMIERSIPMRRLGNATSELGPAILFLASESSSFVTGSVVVVDGGQTLT